MQNVLLVIHLMLALGLICVVLLQRSEGARATAILAAGFMLTSISLTILAGAGSETRSIIEDLPLTAPIEEPAAPSVPVQ
jgi:preprotein translocase subunit SecG